MEARIVPARILALLALALVFTAAATPAQAQGYRAASRNFVVQAPDPHLAEVIAEKAEVFRKDLAVQWLGYELQDWPQKCPITVQIAMQSGGETSFAFIINPRTGESMPVDWDMHIFGRPDRLLDAVLPHEVTHTIFATHFGRPLPRWADEGACTTVECEIEKQKNHQMLLSFLSQRPSRGIPFNQMFIMREYPRDILPLYAQGYSLARFLIMLKGRRHFVDFVEAGMRAEGPRPSVRAWDRTTSEFYGFEDLSDLQLTWQDWVIKGSPDLRVESSGLAAATQPEPQGTLASLPARPQPPQLAQLNTPGGSGDSPQQAPLEAYDDTVVIIGNPGQPQTFATSPASTASTDLNAGWYRSQQRPGRVAAQRQEPELSSPVEVKQPQGAGIPEAIEMSTSADTFWR